MIKLDAGQQVTLVLAAEHIAVILQGLGELKLKVSKAADAEINKQLLEQFSPKEKKK